MLAGGVVTEQAQLAATGMAIRAARPKAGGSARVQQHLVLQAPRLVGGLAGAARTVHSRETAPHAMVKLSD